MSKERETHREYLRGNKIVDGRSAGSRVTSPALLLSSVLRAASVGGPIKWGAARLGYLLLPLLLAAIWFAGGPPAPAEAQDFGDLPAARMEQLPIWHGGSPFTFELHFAENTSLSFLTVRDEMFEVDGGGITRASRIDKSSNQSWEVHVSPDGFGDVSISGLGMTATVPGPRRPPGCPHLRAALQPRRRRAVRGAPGLQPLTAALLPQRTRSYRPGHRGDGHAGAARHPGRRFGLDVDRRAFRRRHGGPGGAHHRVLRRTGRRVPG